MRESVQDYIFAELGRRELPRSQLPTEVYDSDIQNQTLYQPSFDIFVGHNHHIDL
jgi:hypothetical protein